MSFYGPKLPPSLSSSEQNIDEKDINHPSLPPDKGEDEGQSFGPSLPPENKGQSFGPFLPPEDKGQSFGPSLPPEDKGQSFGPSLPPEDKGQSFGPSLPPEDKGQSFGPSLPPENKSQSFGLSLPPDKGLSEDQSFGPSLPPDYDDHNIASRDAVQEEELTGHDIIGPLPPSLSSDTGSQLHERDTRKREIEARTRQMKDRLDGKEKCGPSKPVREEWMMELPPEINPNVYATSMTSRKFRTKYTEIGDRSVWTDTPADKAKKAMEGQKKQKTDSEEEIMTLKRDKMLAQEVEHYNKQHRNVSLVDMHRKRKAETQSVEGDNKERRPFDRDIDLQLPQNIMTDAKRRTLIKDSTKSLDSKFARGKQHFL